MGAVCLLKVTCRTPHKWRMWPLGSRGHFGAIQILVNNAGINTRSDRMPIHQYTLDDWRRILETDLTGVFAASRAVIPHILESHRKSRAENATGRIVNISSIAGLVPLRLQSAYVAAKAGVANLTRSMALELGPGRDPG